MTIERSESRLRSRYDHIFFQAFAVFAGVAVFLGFMQTYYLPGVFTVPTWKTNLLPPHPLIVHIHGVLFSAWFVLLEPVPGIGGDPQGSSICCYSLLFLLAAYDLWSTRNFHRATLWGIISFDLNFNPLIYESASWHKFAAWMQSLGHLFR